MQQAIENALERLLGANDFSKVKEPVYRGWESGAHRLPQTENKDGSYSINYMQVRYTYPQTLAEDLEHWHVMDHESGRMSYPLVEKWYNQLSAKNKVKVTKQNL